MKKTEYRLDEQIRQAFLSLETKWTEKEIGFQVEFEEMRIRNPHRTIYDAFGFVLCNYDCMSAFGKSVFTGIGNAVKYCGTGCVDSVRMP